MKSETCKTLPGSGLHLRSGIHAGRNLKRTLHSRSKPGRSLAGRLNTRSAGPYGFVDAVE